MRTYFDIFNTKNKNQDFLPSQKQKKKPEKFHNRMCKSSKKLLLTSALNSHIKLTPKMKHFIVKGYTTY